MNDFNERAKILACASGFQNIDEEFLDSLRRYTVMVLDEATKDVYSDNGIFEYFGIENDMVTLDVEFDDDIAEFVKTESKRRGITQNDLVLESLLNMISKEKNESD